MKFIYIFCILIFSYNIAQAKQNEDVLSNASRASLDGAHIESIRINVAVENLSNINSTSQSSNSLPYQRKIVYIQHKSNGKSKSFVPIVKHDKKTKFKYVYMPSHVASNKRGYVKFPNVDKDIEEFDINEARNRYQTNIEVFKISENLRQKTINLIK